MTPAMIAEAFLADEKGNGGTLPVPSQQSERST
jgi:hypothetical protein